MSSLVIQTSFLGDVVLTTPLIAELALRGPVDVITTKAGSNLLLNDPRIRNLLIYDKRGSDSGLSGLRALASKVRASDKGTRCTAYLAQGSLRSAALAILAGCKERIGFNTSAGRLLYTKKVEYRDDWHHSRRLLSLSQPSGADPGVGTSEMQLRPSLYPSSSDVEAVDRLLSNRSRDIIVLAPGSVWGTKRWPYYPELAEVLAADFDIAIVGGPEDQKLAELIAGKVPGERMINAVGCLSLLGSAELIGRARAIVTNDSSPQHLASAMNTPTITIFGPTVPEFGFGPLADYSSTAGIDSLPCRPCDRHGPQRCPLGHWKCMKELSVSHIIEQVDALTKIYQSTN